MHHHETDQNQQAFLFLVYFCPHRHRSLQKHLLNIRNTYIDVWSFIVCKKNKCKFNLLCNEKQGGLWTAQSFNVPASVENWGRVQEPSGECYSFYFLFFLMNHWPDFCRFPPPSLAFFFIPQSTKSRKQTRERERLAERFWRGKSGRDRRRR